MSEEISFLFSMILFSFFLLVLLVAYNLSRARKPLFLLKELRPYIDGTIRFENGEIFVVRDFIQHEDGYSTKIVYVEEDGGFDILVVEKLNYLAKVFEPNIISFIPKNARHPPFFLMKKTPTT